MVIIIVTASLIISLCLIIALIYCRAIEKQEHYDYNKKIASVIKKTFGKKLYKYNFALQSDNHNLIAIYITIKESMLLSEKEALKEVVREELYRKLPKEVTKDYEIIIRGGFYDNF